MQLNLFKVLYLCFRLMPFLMITFFLMMTIFRMDMRAGIYLLGVFIMFIIIYILGNTMDGFIVFNNRVSSVVCNTLALGKTERMSKLPLSLAMFSFSIWYILFIILSLPVTRGLRNKTLLANLHLIITLGVLFACEFAWLILYCEEWLPLLLTTVISGFFGAFWAWVINETRLAPYQFNPVKGDTGETCKMTSPNVFVCKK